jgi:hypothetical protein
VGTAVLGCPCAPSSLFCQHRALQTGKTSLSFAESDSRGRMFRFTTEYHKSVTTIDQINPIYRVHPRTKKGKGFPFWGNQKKLHNT